jgi:predicted nucleic acid-binding protein
MHPHLILMEHSNLQICRFRLMETLGLAYHYYLSEQRDFAQSLGWGPTGLEVQGRVHVTAKELERVERFIDAARYSLQQSWDALMAEVFTGRVWPFTSDAAHWYAQLLRHRERLGRSIATADAVIAATALAQGALLATRDVADFADIGLELINPWDTP